MNPSNEDRKQTDNMEMLKQQASGCAPGCNCHATGPSGRRRWIQGTIVLLAAVALVARAVIKTNGAPSQPDTAAFATPTVAQTPGTEGVSATPPVEAATVSGPVVGQEIAAFSELNAAAADMNAVFIFLPAKGQSATGKAVNGIEAAQRTIESKGATKIGVFTLKTDSPDYNQISRQFALPGVIALVKGRGAWVVNQSLSPLKLNHTLLCARQDNEQRFIEEVRQYTDRYAVVPWLSQEPTGMQGLRQLTTNPRKSSSREQARQETPYAKT